MTTIKERSAYERYLGTLQGISQEVLGRTPQYKRSKLASPWTQKVQLLHDIQAERRDIKEKLKKNRACTLSKASLILRAKKVAPLALNLICDFLAIKVVPISNAHIATAKKIENLQQSKLHHIVQYWQIAQDPTQQPSVLFHHKLAVALENMFADLSSPTPTMRLSGGTMAPKNYSEFRYQMIRCKTVQPLKDLCRMRYLKTTGKKSVLVERLMAEKW
jgi:hypothetical protein